MLILRVGSLKSSKYLAEDMSAVIINGDTGRTRLSRFLWLASMTLVVLDVCWNTILHGIRFPTIPISDFRSVVAFAGELSQHGITTSGGSGDLLNAGAPTALAFLIKVSPLDPSATARLATALILGSCASSAAVGLTWHRVPHGCVS